MTTTSLLVEYIVAGSQFCFAIFLCLATFFFKINLKDLKNFDASLDTLLFLGFVSVIIIYPIGMLVDNVADLILKKRHKKIRRKYMKDDITTMQLVVAHDSLYAVNYLNYVRTKIRLSRTTALNVFLIWLNVLLFIIFKLDSSVLKTLAYMIVATIISAVIIFISLWTWKDSTNQYYRQTKVLHTSKKS